VQLAEHAPALHKLLASVAPYDHRALRRVAEANLIMRLVGPRLQRNVLKQPLLRAQGRLVEHRRAEPHASVLQGAVIHPPRGRAAEHAERLEQVALAGAVRADQHVELPQLQRHVDSALEALNTDVPDHRT
jgi:hypothetical protein